MSLWARLTCPGISPCFTLQSLHCHVSLLMSLLCLKCLCISTVLSVLVSLCLFLAPCILTCPLYLCVPPSSLCSVVPMREECLSGPVVSTMKRGKSLSEWVLTAAMSDLGSVHRLTEQLVRCLNVCSLFTQRHFTEQGRGRLLRDSVCVCPLVC